MPASTLLNQFSGCDEPPKMSCMTQGTAIVKTVFLWGGFGTLGTWQQEKNGHLWGRVLMGVAVVAGLVLAPHPHIIHGGSPGQAAQDLPGLLN